MSLQRNAGAVTASILIRNNDDVQPYWYSVLTRLEPEDSRWPRSSMRSQAEVLNDWSANAPTIWDYTVYNYTAGYGGKRNIITGTTIGAGGAILGSCTVKLYETPTDLIMDTGVISDATTGVYVATSPNSTNCYAVAYKAGSPDVAGTTVNTLTPAG